MKLFACTIAVFLFLFATTPLMGWDEGIQYLQANDVKASYEKISVSAPVFPEDSLVRHHAQRFFWPFLIGSISHFSSIKMESIYRIGLIIFYGLLILGFLYSLRALSTDPETWIWSLMILVLNPYFFRYYWIVPGMLPDVAFMCFSTWLAGFAIRKKSIPMLLCFAGALMSRQTAVFLLPALLFWVWCDRTSYRSFFLRAAALVFTFAFVYLGINYLVSSFSEPDNNVGILFSLLSYIQGQEASLFAILELLARVIVPLSLPLGLFLFFSLLKRPDKFSIFLILGVLGVAAQPILGGPIVTGKNAGRLASLGLPWMILAISTVGITFPRGRSKAILFLGFLALASLHHLYSRPALLNQNIFVLVHLLAACLVVLLAYGFREKAGASKF